MAQKSGLFMLPLGEPFMQLSKLFLYFYFCIFKHLLGFYKNNCSGHIHYIWTGWPETFYGQVGSRSPALDQSGAD